MLAHPRFREGRLSTGFIEQEYSGGFDPSRMGEDDARELRALAAVAHSGRERALHAGGACEWSVIDDGEAYPLALRANASGFTLAG